MSTITSTTTTAKTTTATCWQTLNEESISKPSFNPFEDANRLRLEQSILSPNLFQVTNFSTPEKENSNNLWNIDQRAILYPADIPTDENSLLTQYIQDYNLNKQLSAAIEAFWSQNKTVIESPSIQSGLSRHSRRHNGESHETTITTKTSRDQNIDVYKIPALRNFINEKISDGSGAKKKIINDDSDDDEHSIRSQSPDSIDSSNWSEAIGYQDQFSSSPKCKFPNEKDTDILSTPELSPFVNDFKFETFTNNITNNCTAVTTATNNNNITNSNIFQFNFQPIQIHTEHSKFILNSPNLSPIKEDTFKLPLMLNDNKENEPILSMKHELLNDHQTFGKSLHMDVDIGTIIKAPIVTQQQNTSIITTSKMDNCDNKTNLLIKIDDDDEAVVRRHGKSVLHDSSNCMNNMSNVEQKLLLSTTHNKQQILNDLVETTTNQDQDTGYQTCMISSTQFNIMDLTTNYTNQENCDGQHQQQATTSLTMATTKTPKEQQYLLSQSSQSFHQKYLVNSKMDVNTNSNEKHHNQMLASFKDEKSIENLYKESLTLSLTSFTNMYPLGSSTPERSKSIINISNNESYSLNNLNKNLNSENNLCISLSNSGLYRKRAYKRNISLNENLIKNSLNVNRHHNHHNHNNNNNNNKNRDDLFKSLTKSVVEDEQDSAIDDCDSIFKYKMLPSEYARSIIDRALQDLNESKNMNS